MIMSTVYQLLLSWLPSQLVIPLLGLFGLIIILTIFRLVKIVLDALPFL